MSFIGKLFGNADDTEKERTLAVQYWESGQYENCINVCMGIREKILKRKAKGKNDDRSIPFVNHYIYLGLYHLQRWQDAYNFLHDGFFLHIPENHAYYMSIAMELAHRVGEPAETIIKFGELCYDARQKANNIQGIIDCAFTACNTLAMMNECGKNRFFADILIQIGREHRKPEALILGYGYLADNFLQSLDPAIGKYLADAKKEMESAKLSPEYRADRSLKSSEHWTDRGFKSYENAVNIYSGWKPGENPYAEYRSLCEQIQPLLDAGNEEELLKIHKKCLTIAENKFGEHHRLTAITYKDIGISLYNAKNYREALEYFLKELSAWEAAMPAEGPALYFFCLKNIAETYIELDEYQYSETYYNRLMSEYEGKIAPDDPVMHFSLKRLPDVYGVLGKFDLAVEWLNRFIRAKEQEHGSDHPEVIEQRVRLGNIYIRMGKFAEAENILKQALSFYTKTEGDKSKEVGEVLLMLSQVYVYANDYSGAYTYAQPASDIILSTFGEESRMGYQAVENLGLICQHLGRFDEGETYFRRAKIILDKLFPETHPAHGNYLNNMGGFKLETDALDEAEVLLKKALVIRESVYGRNHPDTATTLHNLGLVYAKRNENKTALSYLEEALKIRTQTLGNGHPRVRRTKGYIDDIHRKISGGSSADSEEESETIASSDMLQVAAEVLTDFAYSHCGPACEIVEENKKSLFGLISRKVAIEKFRWGIGLEEMTEYKKDDAGNKSVENVAGAMLDLQQNPPAIIRVTLKDQENYHVTVMAEKKIPKVSEQFLISVVSETIPMNPVLLKETLEKFLQQGILVKENNRLRYTGKK